MPNFKTIPDAARHFEKKSPRTVEGWLDKKYIKPYSDGSRIYVDCDEIERELKTNPHMRDGRRRFGGQPVIPLPIGETIAAGAPPVGSPPRVLAIDHPVGEDGKPLLAPSGRGAR